MRKRERINAGIFILLPLLIAAAIAAGPGAKKFVFTTNSEEARDLFAQGVKALESFDNQKAQQFAQKATEADSNFAFAHMLRAAFASQQDRPKLVEKYTALAANASKGEQMYLEAMSYVHNNTPDKAIEVFVKLHQELPEERMVCMMLGQLNTSKGNYDEAISSFEKARKLDDSTPRAAAFTGNCYVLKDEYAKARGYFQTALKKIGPDASPFVPFFGMSYSYLYEGKPEPALENEKEFLARYQRNGSADNFPPVWIYNNMARINLEFGKLEEAMKLYSQGYESVPGSKIDSTQKIVWYGRKLHGTARTLAKMGKHDEAWKIAEQIKKMIEEGGQAGEEYWEAYHYLAGYLKLEAGDFETAAEHLEQADQNDPFQKLLLARANAKLGNKDYALEICQDIVSKSTFSNIERALAYPEAKKMIAMMTAN